MRLPSDPMFWKAETQYRVERIRNSGSLPLGWVALGNL